MARDLRHASRVTVRITATGDEAIRVLRVEGRLTSEAWHELEGAIGSDPEAACLDLSGLRGADALALAGLRRLRASGVELRAVPPHLACRIDDEAP